MHLLSLLTAVSALPLPFDFGKDVLEPAQRFREEYLKALAKSKKIEAQSRRRRVWGPSEERNERLVSMRPTRRFLRNKQ
jgi:hypothetical protein